MYNCIWGCFYWILVLIVSQAVLISVESITFKISPQRYSIMYFQDHKVENEWQDTFHLELWWNFNSVRYLLRMADEPQGPLLVKHHYWMIYHEISWIVKTEVCYIPFLSKPGVAYQGVEFHRSVNRIKKFKLNGEFNVVVSPIRVCITKAVDALNFYITWMEDATTLNSPLSLNRTVKFHSLIFLWNLSGVEIENKTTFYGQQKSTSSGIFCFPELRGWHVQETIFR